MSRSSRAERRRARRVALVEPLRGRAGSTLILVLDVTPDGMRIVHGSHVARVGEIFALVLEWNEQRILLQCEVRRTQIRQSRENETERTLFESGLRLVHAEEPSMAVFRKLIESAAHGAHETASV